MSLIEAIKVKETIDRLSIGVQLNETVNFFFYVVLQTLQGPEYASKGVTAACNRTRTLEIQCPHGNVFCEAEHVKIENELAARILFSSARTGLDGKVTGHEFLSVVFDADGQLRKIDKETFSGRFGPNARGSDVLLEIVVLMFSKLQHGLTTVEGVA
jgi:hypothetical protein